MERGVGRGVVLLERRIQRDRIERVGRQPAGEVDLVAVTGADVPEDPLDARLELLTVEARLPAPRPSGRQFRSRVPECVLEDAPARAPARDLDVTARRYQGAGAEPSEGEVGDRDRLGPGSRRDALDGASQVVRGEARPPPGREPVE